MDKSVILLLVTALEVKLTHNLMIFYQIMRDFFGDVKSLQSVFIVILGDSNAPSNHGGPMTQSQLKAPNWIFWLLFIS